MDATSSRGRLLCDGIQHARKEALCIMCDAIARVRHLDLPLTAAKIWRAMQGT
jgi:hypothetical protein